MKRLGLAALLFLVVVLVTRLFAHPTQNNFVAVYSDTDGETFAAAHSGWVITNASATGSQTFNLPPAATVLHFIFSLSAAQDIDVNPLNDDQIVGFTDAAGDAISSPSTIGSTVELVAVDATKWLPIRVVGTWSDAN